MKWVACLMLGLLAVRQCAVADVPKSIFDDDWEPDAPQRVQPAAPVAPTPTPAAPTDVTPPTAPAPVSAAARLVVPTATAQANSWKLIKEDLYKDDIANAKTPAQKVELAGKLLAVAQDTNKDPVGKYVLLAQAKELAIGSGDPPTAFKCLDELGRAYNINYPVMKLELFASLAKTVSTPADAQELVGGLNSWADVQVKSDRYDAARKACDIAEGVARKNKDAGLVNQTALHQKQIREIEAAYLRSKPAMLMLSSKPADPAANLAVGEFYCFMKADWDRGLPMLAIGSDVGLSLLAAKELAGISGADAEAGLGDGWWAMADKEEGLGRDRVREHAARWYNEASPNLEGLVKAKVEKRLNEVEPLPGHGPRVVNLLNLFDVHRDTVSGVWTMAHGVLKSDESTGSRIEFPYQPPEEYDFRIVFTRTGGAECVNQICASGGRQFMWVIAGWGDGLCGFEMLGGKGVDQNPTARKEPHWLNNGQEYTSVVKVRKTRVEAYLDGKLISDWKTDYSDMTLVRAWALRHSEVIGVGSNQNTVFRAIEVIEITGKGKTLTEGESGEK